MCAYPAEMLAGLGKVAVEVMFLAWFFYKSVWALLPLSLVGGYRFRLYGARLEKRKRQEFEGQFQECIMAVSTALRAGYSLENAFTESIDDMQMMFGNKSRIVQELREISGGLKNNLSITKVLDEIGKRSESNAVKEFGDIVKIAVQSGGNLVEIISSTADVMAQEKQMTEEIADMVSGKKMEGKIMSLIPFLLVFYVQSSSPDYFSCLYNNLSGIIIMTVCLAVYLSAVITMDKILEIAR